MDREPTIAQAADRSSRGASGPAFSSGLCRLVGVDGVREKKRRATANQERNNETHNSSLLRQAGVF
jgi:hypothetical protein